MQRIKQRFSTETQRQRRTDELNFHDHIRYFFQIVKFTMQKTKESENKERIEYEQNEIRMCRRPTTK